MKATFTSDDGITWDSESDCLGWEKLQELVHNELELDDDCFESLSHFFGDIAPADGPFEKGSVFRKRDLWSSRHLLYRLVELMKEAEQA